MSQDPRAGINYYGYKNMSEMIGAECSPLLDMLLKLSSSASNFSSAANNVKNVSISDKNEIKDLLELVFEIRKLSSKVEKLIENRLDLNLNAISSGVFEAQMLEKLKEDGVVDAVSIGKFVRKGMP